jgi:hypothetical protein
MIKHGFALRITCAAAALTAGAFGVAVADDFSASKSMGPLTVSADTGGGVGVSGDVRASLGAMTGDEDADWLSRVRGGYDYHSDGDSRFWAETIQPLSQTDSSTIFWQARIAHAHDDGTLNAGLGYRWLSPNAKLMLGINTFYDRSFDAGHERVSIGGEAIGPYFSMRANVYEATTGWKDLGGGVSEHALGGADASIDSQAPYMPWLRIGARYYQWNADTANDPEGLQGTLSADITDQFQLVGTYAGDDDPEGEYYLGFRMNLKAGRDKPTAVRQFISDKPLEGRDLKGHTLDFVERENRIITESKGGAYASGTITISRSE